MAQVMVPWAHTPGSPVLHAAVLLGAQPGAEDATGPEDAPTDEPAPELSWDDPSPELPSDDAIPELASDDAIPELASDDAIPELASDDAIPELASDDAIPVLLSGCDEEPGPLWPDPALEVAPTALDAGRDVTGAVLDPDTARDVAAELEAPDAVTLVDGAALDDGVGLEVLPAPELRPRLEEACDAPLPALVAPPPEEDVTPPDDEDEASGVWVQAPRHSTTTQQRQGMCLMCAPS